MSRIRVAIGDVQSAMLRDILAQIADLERDMELVGEGGTPALGEADVVICDIRNDELPKLWTELSAGGRRPVLVGLAHDGREAAVCIPNAGSTQLMAVIRSVMAGAGENDKVVDLARRFDGDRDPADAAPYTSAAECLGDQFRLLDLALLAEIDAFEATLWDESAQRLQGLAISPDEVRTLLQASTRVPSTRQSGELRRRRQRLQDASSRRIAATVGRPEAPAFVRLIDRFGLSAFEQFSIAATLAVEIDRNKYGKAYALLQDDVTRKQPSLELLIRLYGGADEFDRWTAVTAFDSAHPLSRWGLVKLTPREAGDPATPFGRRIELDDRISRFLLGLEDLGPPLDEFVAIGAWPAEVLRVQPPRQLEDRLARLVGSVQRGAPGAPRRVVVHVYGRQGSGRRSLVAALCRRSGLHLLRVDASRLAALPTAASDDALMALERESMLQPTALCFEHLDAITEEDRPHSETVRALVGALPNLSQVTFVLSHRPWAPEGVLGDGVFQSVALDLPDREAALRTWTEELAQVLLAPEDGTPEEAARELAGRFRLSAGQIHDAIAATQTRALWEKAPDTPLRLADLYRGCREQCTHRLGSLARHVTTTFGWDDLVLPPKQYSQLRELETAIRNSAGVLQDWNFESRLPYGRGITALFSGPSGTGKTMAAGILARELGLDLYKIDLSRVVSKYVGETEKNLDRIFQQAEDANAMLFFDEADALFGKRSAIKDAHDRYANIEIAYLLQKMEERLGVTILASNLKTNMDEAFVRRIRFGVEFLMPEYAERIQIWRSSLPKALRLADDVDLTVLAKRLRVSGGSIMNVCVGAASLAYAPGAVIGMQHFAHAAKRELEKLGHQYHETDFAPREATTSGTARPEARP
jgi:AAA+ superfamily predicted ATPase